MATDEAVLQERATPILEVDLPPGTDVIRDVDETHSTHSPNSDVVLIPHPSKDPQDPLNWSKSWKYLVITTQFLYTFVTVESALSMAPMFPLLAKEFHLDQTQLSLLTGASVLALGYANFVIVPCSNVFGRRMTSLLFGIFVILTSLWEALATSHRSLLAARVMNGLSTATSESIMVQVVADIFFLHERGFWTGLYFTAYFLGLFLGPVIAGNIAERHGWRSFFWLSLALAAFNVITLFFAFPETKYRRQTGPKQTLGEKGSEPPQKNDVQHRVDGDESQSQEDTAAPTVGRGRPSMTQFRLTQRPDSRWKSFLVRDILSPFRAFFYPIVFWAGLNVAGPANLLLFWNLTESAVLSAPPYSWNPSSVGYSNFAFVVGGLIGLATAGPSSDWIAKRAALRNNGIREAEMRLIALIPYFVTTVIGIVVGGLAYQHLWPWPVILVFGYAFTGLSVTTIPTIAIAYALDCYKPISGEIMVVATILKNTCGFSMSYWVPSLAQSQGYLTPAMVEFALTIGPLLLAVPLYFYGKRLRTYTRHSKLHEWEAER